MIFSNVRTVIGCMAFIIISACSKLSLPGAAGNPGEGESLLTINLTGDSESKASGAEHGIQAEDNYINTLEIFIFHAEGNKAGKLDAYKKFTPADGIRNLQIKATTGRKKMYVVANSHRGGWPGVNTLPEFQQERALLQEDNVKDYLMTGEADVTLQVATSVTLPVSRLVARVCLASIKGAFRGTPYEGCKLSNVKAYLINVHGVKHIHDGSLAVPVILNPKAPEETDINSCAMPGMLFEAVPAEIEDTGYTTPHYFYTYENRLETETERNRFTRLVIQADLNGNTYYYPVNINQPGYGYTALNAHRGVKRNTSYEIHVTILRPGSIDPDQPMEHGALSVNLNVLDWNTLPVANPEF